MAVDAQALAELPVADDEQAVVVAGRHAADHDDAQGRDGRRARRSARAGSTSQLTLTAPTSTKLSVDVSFVGFYHREYPVRSRAIGIRD